MRKNMFLFLLGTFAMTITSVPADPLVPRSICASIGKLRLATFRDTWKKGDRQYSWAFPETNCTTIGFHWTGWPYPQKWCGVNRDIVGQFNSQASATCYRSGNRFTEQCWMAEKCLTYSGGVGEMCAQESYEATITWADPRAIDCNNMQSGWVDAYGGTWAVQQGNQSQFISGTINTNTSTIPATRCGRWTFTGLLLGNGHISLQAVNRSLPAPRPCLLRFTYSGITAGPQSFGAFRNSKGQRGEFRMYRKDPLPGAGQYRPEETPVPPEGAQAETMGDPTNPRIEDLEILPRGVKRPRPWSE